VLADATDANFEERILELCPQAVGKFRKTSPRDRRYNCLAWSVGDTTRPWVPGGDPVTTRWPPGAPRHLDLNSVVASYASLGFERDSEPVLTEGFDRVALFVDHDGDVIHAALQLASGRWTSKMGEWEDIEHDDLAALEGGEYGQVAAVLRRPRAAAPTR